MRPELRPIPVISLLRLGKRIYPRLVLSFGFVYFGLNGLICTLVSTPLYALLPRRLGAWLGRNMIGWQFRSYLAMLKATGIIRLDLGALDSLQGERGLLLAPNHPSLLDAVLIISRLPAMTCIMKAKIWDNPFLGAGARLAGYIRNDSPGKMVRVATAELRAGHQLLVFPESTRSRDGCLNPFKGGFALIARNAGAQVQTVFIETNSGFLGKGWPLLKMPDLPLYYGVRLGRRFRVEGDIKTFVSDLEAYYREELERPPTLGIASSVEQPDPAVPGHAR